MFGLFLRLILWLGVPGVIALVLAAVLRGLVSAAGSNSSSLRPPSRPSSQSGHSAPNTRSATTPVQPRPGPKAVLPPSIAQPGSVSSVPRWETVECSFCGVAESVASGASGFYCRNCQRTRPVARSSAPNAPTSQIKAVRCSSCGQISNMARAANQFYCRTCNTTRADTGLY